MPQDWGWARRAAPGLAGSPLEAPWLVGGAAGSDESRLMSAWTRGLGSDTGVVVWKPGRWGRLHSTARRRPSLVNTSRHQRQHHLGASGVAWVVVSGVGSPERLPG